MENEKSEECDSCGFRTEALIAYPVRRNFPKESAPKWLCDLCASTMAGNAHEYPEQFREGRAGDVMKTICFVGNTILAAIASARDAAGDVNGK
jgi:hypothetical protein